MKRKGTKERKQRKIKNDPQIFSVNFALFIMRVFFYKLDNNRIIAGDKFIKVTGTKIKIINYPYRTN